MATETKPEFNNAGAKGAAFTKHLEFELALEFMRVVEEAAIASAKTMGLGDRKRSDHVATEAMRAPRRRRCR